VVELGSVFLDDVPDYSLRHTIAPSFSGPANAPKNSSGHDSRGQQPVVESLLNPVWERNGSDMASLSNQVHNGPVVFAPLNKVKGQFGKFPTTQPAAQQNGEKCSIAFAFEGLDPWRLPEAASFVSRQPVPKPDTQLLLLRPLDTTLCLRRVLGLAARSRQPHKRAGALRQAAR